MRPLLLSLLTTFPAQAQEAPFLAFPVDCDLGKTCMIQQLVDHDPGPETHDFHCGPMSYDGHQGTDIRVPDMADLDAGVSILAAAPGTVLGVRNVVPDTGRGGFPEGQDCGNGILLDHGNGWQTQYCHLAEGSVSVVTGDLVETGQPIGLMGFSGNTEFPHLHLTVRQNDGVVDPFAPDYDGTCNATSETLWIDNFPVPPGGILTLGFAGAIPSFEAIQDGTANANTLSGTGEAIVLWGYFHGGRVGDLVTLTITTPDGVTYFTQETALDRTQAELFRAGGRQLRDPLVPGTYTGTVTLARDGVLLDTETVTIPVR